MTNKEARNYILANYFDGDEDVRAVVGGDEEHLAMKCAVEALEKQILKKPDNIILYDEYSGSFKLCYGKCKCGETVAKIYMYCPNCGQKIDWSDNDE